MRLRLLQSTVLFALVAAPAILIAEAVSSNEEERLENLARSDDEWVTPKNSVTVGFRMLTSGGRVHFGNLGSVPFVILPLPASAGKATRIYQNGYVRLDSPRPDELNSLAQQTSTPNGRYQVTTTTTQDVTDSAGNVTTVTSTTTTGDFLSYTDGLSRQWSYDTPQQATLRPGYIAMSNYSATSDGAAMDKKEGISSGLEMQFAHVMGKLSKRTDWSLVAGVTLNGINSKTAGDVTSTLNAINDFFALPAVVSPNLPGSNAPPTSVASPYTAPINDPVHTTTEITIPISDVQDPNLSTTTHNPGGVIVHGRWQVKGAYFMVRVGPSIHTQLTERLGLSATLGLAGAFASSYYTEEQSMEVPVVGTTLDPGMLFNYTSKFLGGYYADFNLDWSANDRTGIYGGLSAQKLGSYNTSVYDQTAHVDLGTSVGIRGGISIKF